MLANKKKIALAPGTIKHGFLCLEIFRDINFLRTKLFFHGCIEMEKHQIHIQSVSRGREVERHLYSKYSPSGKIM